MQNEIISSVALERTEARSTQLIEHCLTRLEIIKTKVSQSGIVVDDYQLSGSLISGAAFRFPLNDVDVIVRMPEGEAINQNVVESFASAVGSENLHITSSTRFGQLQQIAHVKSNLEADPSLFRTWDFWIVSQPFVAMTPFWSQLFSKDEINWQREIRQLVSSHLSTHDYEYIKSCQISEARWRFCASYALSLIDLDVIELGYIREDLPLTGPLPTGTDAFIRGWISGDMTDSWYIRPLKQFPTYIRESLGRELSILYDVPLAPAWTEVAMRIQEMSINAPMVEAK